MKARPILFSTDMVQAQHNGLKTQTRRTKGLEKFNINPDAFTCAGRRMEMCRFWREDVEKDPNPLQVYYLIESSDGFENKVKCPFGKIGDLLWVRETFAKGNSSLLDDPSVRFYIFKDGSQLYTHGEYVSQNRYLKDKGWKPSIHMPKEAARIWLQITNIKVERLKQITHEDALAEGILDFGDGTYKNYFKKKGLRTQDGAECILPIASFQSLWCSINGIESWDANPWVWVIEFEVVSKTGFLGIPESIRKELVA